MEKTKRVLAYRLAKEIVHEKLDEVSGGNNHSTKKITERLTGEVNHLDTTLDQQIDW